MKVDLLMKKVSNGILLYLRKTFRILKKQRKYYYQIVSKNSLKSLMGQYYIKILNMANGDVKSMA